MHCHWEQFAFLSLCSSCVLSNPQAWLSIHQVNSHKEPFLFTQEMGTVIDEVWPKIVPHASAIHYRICTIHVHLYIVKAYMYMHIPLTFDLRTLDPKDTPIQMCWFSFMCLHGWNNGGGIRASEPGQARGLRVPDPAQDLQPRNEVTTSH